MQQPDLTNGIIWYVVFLYSTVLHEAAHAWAAKKMGDSTAYEGGQVSLDPTPHIQREPVGMILMPVITYLLYGWTLGWASAPYDPHWALKYPKRAALMAAAGPLADLLLLGLTVVLMFIGVRAGVFVQPGEFSFEHILISNSGPAWEGCALILSISFSLNFIYVLFNLIPLPPMDGSALPLLFLNQRHAEAYLHFTWQPAMKLMGYVVAFNGFKYIFGPSFAWFLGWFYSIL